MGSTADRQALNAWLDEIDAPLGSSTTSASMSASRNVNAASREVSGVHLNGTASHHSQYRDNFNNSSVSHRSQDRDNFNNSSVSRVLDEKRDEVVLNMLGQSSVRPTSSTGFNADSEAHRTGVARHGTESINANAATSSGEHSAVKPGNGSLNNSDLANEPLSRSALVSTTKSPTSTVATPTTQHLSRSTAGPPQNTSASRVNVASSSRPFAIRDTAGTDFPSALLCQICAKAYSDPRVLDCLHTFCFQCIQTTLVMKDTSSAKPPAGNDNKIYEVAAVPKLAVNATASDVNACVQCPVCTQVTSLRPGALPYNHIIAADVAHLGGSHSGPLANTLKSGGIVASPNTAAAARKRAPPACRVCQGRNAASLLCGQCNEELCGMCAEVHSKLSATRDHIVTPLTLDPIGMSNTGTEDDAAATAASHSVCATHGLACIVYCPDCETVACQTCAVRIHHGHPYTLIEEATTIERSKLRTMVSEAEELHDSIGEWGLETTNSLKTLQRCHRTAVADITRSFAMMHDTLERRRRILIQKVEDSYKDQALALEVRCEDTNNTVASLRRAKDLAERVATSPGDVECLMLQPILSNALEAALSSSAAAPPPPTKDPVGVTVTIDEAPFKAVVATIGRIR